MDRIEQIQIVGPPRMTLLEYELAGLLRALSENGWNQTGAQHDLKIGRTRFRRLLKMIRRPETSTPTGAGDASDPLPPGGG
jgi:hypothetical protein